MQRIAKLVKRGPPVVVLFVTMSVLFTGQPSIFMKSAYITIDQFVKQDNQGQSTANDQTLGPELTYTTQSPSASVTSESQLTFSSLPLVQPPNRGKGGDLTYAGGHVIEGIANVYLIFWQDPSFQEFSPKYMSLIKRFVTDVGKSPLYAVLSQYTDSNDLHPTGVKLAGTFLETSSFPQALVNDLNQSNFSPKVMDRTWKREITNVATKEKWNTKDYHNIFAVLANTRRPDACGYHNVLATGSPYLFVSFPSINGKLTQGCNHSRARVFPNGDSFADVAVSIFSHELSEAVTDPLIDGWGSSGNDGEIGDKCNQAPYGINQRTKGDVTWFGDTYLIQREYNNNKHGCTLRP